MRIVRENGNMGKQPEWYLAVGDGEHAPVSAARCAAENATKCTVSRVKITSWLTTRGCDHASGAGAGAENGAVWVQKPDERERSESGKVAER